MRHCFYNESLGFFYNNSRKELKLATGGQPWQLLLALGLAVSALVLLANLLVIAAVATNRRFHHPIYYLLANLAAADLFAGVAYMFLMFHTGPRTARLSLKTWFVRQSLLDTSLTASVVNLLAIAVERHRTVLTMQLHSEMSAQRVVGLIFSIWAAALLLGLIPSYGWHCLCSLESCSRMAPLYSRSYLTFWAISNLVVFLVMVLEAWRVTRHPGHTGDTVMALVKTVTIILGAFVVCWTPGQVLLLLDGLGCASCDVLAVEKYVLLLAEVNSLINAVVYSWRDNEMRSTFRRLLCLPCPRHAKYAAPERGLSSHNDNCHFTVDSSI
uniref:Uncharacterized protein n=1 Tax=Geospiza parvula TaxID=87175 RepID=A0A8U8BG92_GEOPR